MKYTPKNIHYPRTPRRSCPRGQTALERALEPSTPSSGSGRATVTSPLCRKGLRRSWCLVLATALTSDRSLHGDTRSAVSPGLERAKGLEPSTFSLGSGRSTAPSGAPTKGYVTDHPSAPPPAPPTCVLSLRVPARSALGAGPADGFGAPHRRHPWRPQRDAGPGAGTGRMLPVAAGRMPRDALKSARARDEPDPSRTNNRGASSRCKRSSSRTSSTATTPCASCPCGALPERNAR